MWVVKRIMTSKISKSSKIPEAPENTKDELHTPPHWYCVTHNSIPPANIAGPPCAPGDIASGQVKVSSFLALVSILVQVSYLGRGILGL